MTEAFLGSITWVVAHSCPKASKKVCIEALVEVVVRKVHRILALVAAEEALTASKAMKRALLGID